MATSSLNGAVGPERLEIGQMRQVREALRGDAGHVPEQVELAHAVEPGQAWPGPSSLNGPSINRWPGLPPSPGLAFIRGNACSRRRPSSVTQRAAAEGMQVRLPLKRRNRAVANRARHRLHVLELVARRAGWRRQRR